MGSITDALKAKGATGSNIAECIETLPSGGGSGDPEYTIEEVTKKLYFDGEITTEKQDPAAADNVGSTTITLEKAIFDPTIVVTFDGTQYVCAMEYFEYLPKYGGSISQGVSIFTDYPFIIKAQAPECMTWQVMTEVAGTHTLRIEIKGDAVTTTSGFKKAVNSVAALVVNYNGYYVDKTYQECLDAWNQGRAIIFRANDPSSNIPDALARYNRGDGSQAPDYFVAEIMLWGNYSSSGSGTITLMEDYITLNANDQFNKKISTYAFSNVVKH